MPPVLIAVAAAAAYAAVTSGAIGLAAALGGGALGALGASVIGALAASAVSYLGNLLFYHSRDTGPAQTVRQPLATHKIIAGCTRAGGAVTFMDSNGGVASEELTNGNEYLDVMVTLAAHAVQSFLTFYFNNIITPYDPTTGLVQQPPELPNGIKLPNYHGNDNDGYAWFYPGNGTTVGDAAMLSELAANTAFWTPDCLQAGRAKVFVKLKWSTTAYGSVGIPNISATMMGRMVYDPRESSIAIDTSASGTPGLFTTINPHGFAPGNCVWVIGHEGATPIGQPTWPGLQQTGVVQFYEVNTCPSSTEFTLLGPDGNPLGLLNGGTGGLVQQLGWTDNATLVINDYLCDPYYGVAADYENEVPEAQLVAAANICDETVTQPNPTTTFTADSSTNTISYKLNQNAGDIPQYCQVMVSSSGSLPSGLSANTLYWFVSNAGPEGYLCNDLNDARSIPPVPINFTDDGSGTLTLEIVETFIANQIPAWQNLLSLYSGTLRLFTGDEVTLNTLSGGSLPNPLSSSTTYFVVFYDARLIGLATSLANARAGNIINLTSNGTQDWTHLQIRLLSEVRYRCDGVVDTGQPRQQIIQEMLTSMQGYLVPAGTQLGLYPAAYLTPTVSINCDISPSDLRGPIELTTLRSAQESFNSVRGVFIDPFRDWQPTDMPNYQNTTYIQQDNGETIWKDIRLPYTVSSSCGQRFQKLTLERVRRELRLLLKGKFTLFQISPPDVVNLNSAKFGWSDETFEIQSWTLTKDEGENDNDPPALGIDLVANETDSAVFAWTAAEIRKAKHQTTTSLPSPFSVAPPTNFAVASGDANLLIQPDGTVVARAHLTWDAPVDTFVVDGGHIDVRYKKSSSSNWLSAGPPLNGDEIECYIDNVTGGDNYDFAIRSRSRTGELSDTSHPWQAELDSVLIEGKSANPSDVAFLTIVVVPLGATLYGSPITDTDIAVYEYRYGASASWSSMTVIGQAVARPAGSGFAGSYSAQNLPTGTFWFGVKAVDTSGNYSVNAAFAQATITNSVGSTSIADGSITIAKFIAGITPVQIVTSLPGTATEGDVCVLTTDGQLYRYHAGAWTLDVPTVNLVGTISGAQIASGAISGTQIASGLLLPLVVSTLPTPPPSITTGQIAYLTSDQKIYRWNGTSWIASVATSDLSGTISGSQLASGIIDATKIASGLSLPAVGATLPGSGTEGQMFFNTTDGQLYRYHSGAWTVYVAAGSITGTLVTSQIAAGAITTALIANAAVTSTQIASGTITGSNIAAQTILPSNVYIGDTSNMVIDSMMADYGQPGVLPATVASGTFGSWFSSNGFTVAAGSGTTSSNVFTLPSGASSIASAAIPVVGGVSYYFSVVASVAVSKGLSVTWYSDNAATSPISTGSIGVSSSTPVQLFGLAAAPSNAVRAKLQLLSSVGMASFSGPIMRRAVDANLIVAGSITATQIAANTITGSNIGAGTLTATNIASGTITATQIATGTITATQIASATITATQIAAATITGSKIAAGTITSSLIAAGAITSGTIAAGAIGTTQLAAGSVVASKIFIGDTSNMIPDPAMADQTGSWVANNGFTVTAGTGTLSVNIFTIGASSTHDYIRSTPIPIDGINSPSYYYYCRMNNSGTQSTATGFYVLYFQDIACTTPSAINSQDTIASSTSSSAVSLSAIRTAPTDSCRAIVQFDKPAGATSSVEFYNPIMRRATDGSLVVAGSITATAIAAATITGSKIAANTITDNNMLANTITAGSISAGAIGTTQLAAGGVTASKIAAGTITATQIASNTITASQIASNAIGTAELAANAVTAGNIAANAVTAGTIAAGAIATSNLTAGCVTTSKLVVGAVSNTNSWAAQFSGQSARVSILSHSLSGSVGGGPVVISVIGWFNAGSSASEFRVYPVPTTGVLLNGSGSIPGMPNTNYFYDWTINVSAQRAQFIGVSWYDTPGTSHDLNYEIDIACVGDNASGVIYLSYWQALV